MNSHPASRAASATLGVVSQTFAFMDIVGRMPLFSKACSNRQKPTRIPYSCQVQFGISGISADIPPGGGEAWRGIGLSISHSSMLTTGQIIKRVPSSVFREGLLNGEL